MSPDRRQAGGRQVPAERQAERIGMPPTQAAGNGGRPTHPGVPGRNTQNEPEKRRTAVAGITAERRPGRKLVLAQETAGSRQVTCRQQA